MHLIGWLLILIASFAAADAVMTLVFERRYLRWGAGFLPPEYRALIERILRLPVTTLRLFALVELAFALSLHWLGWKMTLW